jgi:plasmid stabilization system protein ParE
MKLILRTQAYLEFLEAVDFYNEHSATAAKAFAAEIQEVFADIERNPKRFIFIHERTQVALCPKFPFKVLFRAGRTLEVVAIYHHSRDPMGWTRP